MDDTQRTKVLDTIHQVFPEIGQDKAQELLDHLCSNLGLDSFDSLSLVKETDLTDHLLPLQARKLIRKWGEVGTDTQALGQSESTGLRGVVPQVLPLQGTNFNSMPNVQNIFQIDWADIYSIRPKMEISLQKGKVPQKKERKEIVKRLVNQVRYKVPHATRQTFRQVANDLRRKYPAAFRNELANGAIGKHSYAKYMADKFDNDRRPPRRTTVESEAPNIKEAYGCRKWRLLALPSHETQASQESTRKGMVTHYETVRKMHWDWDYVHKSMSITYKTQRDEINAQTEACRSAGRDPDDPEQEPISTAEIRNRWPFLFQHKEMMAHFSTLTATDLEDKIITYEQNAADKMMEFLKTQSVEIRKIYRSYQREVKKGRGHNVQLAAILRMLLKFFQEDEGEIFQLLDEASTEEDIPKDCNLPQTPCLVVAGRKILRPTKIFLTIDQTVVGRVENFKDGLEMLFASYYIFNINYPARAQVTLEFFQRCIAEINPVRGNKRPPKKDTIRHGGRFSTSGVHSVLASFNRKYSDYFAERAAEDESESSNDSS